MARIRPWRAGRRAETKHGPSEIAPLATDLRAGTQLAGYRIESVLGRGGMGVVYRAEHLHLGRPVALKLLVPDLVEDEAFRERFVREARIAGAIDHPHIVTVYDAGEAEGMLYIAMQYVEGTHLGELVRARGSLDPPRAVALLAQVADALDSAHAHGVVHRDIKPENVLVQSDHCYLTDFGLTKRMSSRTALTARGNFVGTIDYMAPEQIEGADLDGRADVYALGCVLYHCLTGAVPYPKESEVSVMYGHLQEAPPAVTSERDDLPAALDGVIARAMAKKRDDRYPTCTALIAAVEEAIGARARDGAPPAEAPSVPAAKVLVASEDAGVRAVIRASLKSSRFDVMNAADADSAIALARRERPGLAFVDCDLPGGSVEGLSAALREDPDTAATKIVAIVDRADRARSDALLAAGAADYIVRPFSPLQVLFKVRDHLGPDLVVD